jgi:hypothetical protein
MQRAVTCNASPHSLRRSASVLTISNAQPQSSLSKTLSLSPHYLKRSASVLTISNAQPQSSLSQTLSLSPHYLKRSASVLTFSNAQPQSSLSQTPSLSPQFKSRVTRYLNVSPGNFRLTTYDQTSKTILKLSACEASQVPCFQNTNHANGETLSTFGLSVALKLLVE